MGKSQTQNQFDWKVSQSSRSPRPCCECIRGRSEPIGRNLLSRWLGCLKVGHAVTSLDGSSYQWRIRITSIWNLVYAPPLLSKVACVGRNADCQGQWLWLMKLLFGFWTVSSLPTHYWTDWEIRNCERPPRRSPCFVLVLWSNSISTRCLLLILQHL